MIKKILKFFDITTIKFLMVGVINTLVGTGLMFILYNVFSVNYWISSASNYIVGSIVSYFLNKYFTFQNKEKSWKQILSFIVNITVCYLIAYGVAKPVNNIRQIQKDSSSFWILYIKRSYYDYRVKNYQREDNCRLRGKKVREKPILYMIIPCYNEESVLPITAPMFLEKLEQLEGNEKIHKDSRILFVNDGSRDRTWEIIKDLSEKDNRYQGIAQSRNRGHQNAVLAGLMEAKDKGPKWFTG